MPRTTIRLRSKLPLLWIGLLVLASILIPDRIWTTLLIGVGGLFLLSYLWARDLAQGVRGERRLRFGWVAVGDRLSESFVLYNRSTLPAFWIEIQDTSTVPGYRPAVVRSLNGNSTLRWRQSAVCQRRGQFHLGPWSLTSADPFGIFEVSVHYDTEQEIVIHPPVHTHLPIPLPAGTSSGRSRARERSWQATINAASVRDYQPYDPYRWIHWPTSARKGELHVRQFDLDAAGDVWLVCDLQAAVQLGSGNEGTEEHIVLLAASLAAQALRENRPVGLASYGEVPRVVAPGSGEGQQWRILRNLALAKADGESSLQRILKDVQRIARRGSAAIIITPTATADWLSGLLLLGQAGVQPHVLLLDRETFGGDGNSRALCEGVRQLGANCHLVGQGEIGRPPEAGEHRGFWEFKTLATGKVVVVKRPDNG